MKKFITDEEFNKLYGEVNNLMMAAYGLDVGSPVLDKIMDRLGEIHDRLGARRAPEYIRGVIDGGRKQG